MVSTEYGMAPPSLRIMRVKGLYRVHGRGFKYQWSDVGTDCMASEAKRCPEPCQAMVYRWCGVRSTSAAPPHEAFEAPHRALTGPFQNPEP